jgi:hypothetical protein
MRRTVSSIGCAAAVTLAAASAAVATGPNQGNPYFVKKADNKYVSCAYPTPGKKFEGAYGRTIYVSAYDPIDYVTIKSGRDAYVVSTSFYDYGKKAKITMSKDVSNFVIWTCPKKY